ncbi:MAG: hypothetical protein ACRD2I_03920, partial [Vicinamibacterales bacterium]
DHLSTTEGSLNMAPVVSRADVTLGTLAGALVDPVGRNVCYLVVDSRRPQRSQRYLLPLGTTRFDRARGALLVDADVTDLLDFPVTQFARFSDEDLITAIFSRSAA